MDINNLETVNNLIALRVRMLKQLEHLKQHGVTRIQINKPSNAGGGNITAFGFIGVEKLSELSREVITNILIGDRATSIRNIEAELRQLGVDLSHEI